jgi:hypothetical protein
MSENKPNDPVLVSPADPITSCEFTIQVEALEDVFCEIYDESGRQITRECVNGRPGPVGTLRLVQNPSNGLYEASACLCEVRNDSAVRIVLCSVRPTGGCSFSVRSVNLKSPCPQCPTGTSEEIDDVVEELRMAVTQRVVEELRDAVEKIAGSSKRAASTKPPAEPEADRTTRRRRRRRRK